MIPEVISFTLLSALYDKGKRFTNHIPRFIFRAVVIFLISLFEPGNIIANFLFYSSVFFLLFDYILNVFENREWCYIGKTAILDKFRHKIFGKFVCWGDFMIKILLVSTTLILKTYLQFN